MLHQAIARKAFPGAAAAITHHGRLIALKGVGSFTYDPGSAAVDSETIYDLASVTKVVATTALCMIQHEQGAIHLDAPFADLLPEFNLQGDPRRGQVTLRMVLAHSSGLPAYIRLFESARNREDLIEQALRVPLQADPGSRAEYSDIGFILLGVALERLLGRPLDELCREQVFSRLGLASLRFKPPADWKPHIPPSVHDLVFRQRVVQGEVHDENASVMGGVAGHAGCFGTALDVARFAECMLRGGAPLISSGTVETFTHREPAPVGTSRALGWDTPSQPSQSGQYLSSRAFGHLGYTGTSLWIDPERRLSVTLLTNRTWPDRSSQQIKQVRPAFHDAVIEALN